MPISKRRKKNGKVVKKAAYKRDIPDDRPIGVTLQDLINMVAYQDMVADGRIKGPVITDTPWDGMIVDAEPGDVVSKDVTVHMDNDIPVMVAEGEDRRQIGTASPIPGDESAISVHITDRDILSTVRDTSVGDYSIDTRSMTDGR